MKALFAEQRTWLGVGIITAILLVLAGWFTLIGPVRADTGSLAGQETDARGRNAALTHQLVVLEEQKQDLPALRAALGAQVRALPTGSGLPELTRQLTGQARTTGVGVKSVVVGAITPLVKTATGYTMTPAAGAARTPAEAAGRLFAIPVTVTTTGRAAGQIAFIKALQQSGSRRALIVSTQLAPADAAATTTAPAAASTDAASTMTTVLTVFSAPLSPEGQAQLDRLIAGASTD